MAYSTSNPPRMLESSVGSSTGSVWVYVSADAVATVKGAGYFTNGDDLGMSVGDLLLVSDTTTPLGSTTVVSAVTSGGAATVV